jgi:murein DD-endopeptidase MepM/ murein hydrolase activator NlpD
VIRSILRRPLFSALATAAVLGGASAAHVAGAPLQPQVAEAAFTVPVELDPAAAGLVATQSAADSADDGFQDASRVRIQQQQAATEAARVAAEQARVAAEAAAEQARLAAEAAAEQARIEAEAAAAAQAARAAAAEEAARNAQRDPRGVASLMVADRGWGSEQFGCLDRLWTKESNWSWSADNPSSSAYGIPQALPGSKMSSAGADWATNPVTQITWGLGYIESRYGSPCSAWSHSQSNNWY